MSDIPMSQSGQDADDNVFDLEREPLDKPEMMERDWGGDGSDLSRPVRAHVLATLRPNSGPYHPPLDALLHLGDPRDNGVEEQRNALGIGQESVPELLRMVRDRKLATANSDTDEVWAPIHAFRILRNLDVSAHIAELVPLFDLEDDWYDNELPELMAKVGEPALAPLRDYLADRTRWAFGHSFACSALEKIVEQHPELREQVITILSDVLRNAEDYHEIAVTGAMGGLVELKAVEELPLIRRTFEIGKIDEMVYGPWGQVLQEMSVEPEEGDPLLAESERRFEERQEQFFPRAEREEMLASLERFAQNQRNQTAGEVLPARTSVRSKAQEKARKQKNKRKAESAARKANRKKRK